MDMNKNYSIDIQDRMIYPMGVTAVPGGIHATFVFRGQQCALLLFKKGGKGLQDRIIFPEDSRMGDVWSMTVKGDFTDLEYAFEADGEEVPDPYGHCFTGRGRWGDTEKAAKPARTPFFAEQDEFDWEGDRQPRIPFKDSIMYRIHPRGFTKHASSGVESGERGTFKGIIRKIPYMKELGITTVEMMPPVEFDEVILPERNPGDPFGPEEDEGKLNYWGYVPGFSFAPKASYSSTREKGAAQEFKTLVKELHKAGMELVIELFFSGKEAPAYILDVVRWWAGEYHVDGVHLVGCIPGKLLAEDPYLSRLKLYADSWNEEDCGSVRRLAEYNQGFMMDMRSFLKGDENQLNKLAYHTRRNPVGMGTVNYMANTNGFTLMDMVSYDAKHNEDNGEDNRDGTDYNQSWNCGVEGPTKKKKILQLRRKQLRNAMLLLFLSQGIPLLMAGDEFGRTKKGNNNSYCQDNEISWINWNLLKSNSSLYEFIKYAIAFRKAHPVFHMEKEPALMDYRSLGLPDVSYHGVKAWCPDFGNQRRQLGIFYNGAYGKKENGKEDDYFYVAYNSHWEPYEFALPNLPKGMKWHVAFDTEDDVCNGIYEPGTERLLEDQKMTWVMDRSIMVFIGKKAEKAENAEESQNRQEQTKKRQSRKKQEKQEKEEQSDVE